MINRKAIKGKYYTDIIQGIEKRYGELYTDNTVFVHYKSEDSCYFFEVCIDGRTINSKNEIVDTAIVVAKHYNESAIEIFASKYSIEDFNREYNDYSEDNYKTLEEEINKLTKKYADEYGFVFTDIGITEYSYHVRYYHPKYSKTYKNILRKDEIALEAVGHSFAVRPITKATMKNAIRNVKQKLSHSVDKLIPENER